MISRIARGMWTGVAFFVLASPALAEDAPPAEEAAAQAPAPTAATERVLLTPEELERDFSSLEGWVLSEDKTKISKSFVFADFVEAFGFMASVALIAERLDHHPDWRNIYKTVDISLNSYTLGGVTNKDIALAKRIDALLKP